MGALLAVKLSRRQFLATSAVALAGCKPSAITPHKFTGQLLGPSASVGHLLREALAIRPRQVEKKSIAIVGGGIAGLSAARRLQQRGHKDFVLLELENSVGGNSRFAENSVSPAPWGAHYVPLPSAECQPVLDLFKDLGIITGADAEGRPIYNEFYLCAEPMERLFINGAWQEGLLPTNGISREDKRQYDAFAALMDEFRNARGADGKRAFVIPVDESSRDPKFTALDRQTMTEFMDAHRFTSKPLRWYIDYACRDDFGAHADQVSAWAGVHYFASRGGIAANANSQTVVTWPEGNGWLVRQLQSPVAAHIRPNSLAYRITQSGDYAAIDVIDSQTRAQFSIEADQIIFCAPRFVAHHVVEELQVRPCPATHYAPWVVANITLTHKPTGHGSELAWDNVFYDSPSLGYVVATHQNPSRRIGKTVITYYHALCDHSPIDARREAQKRTYTEWCDLILADVEKVHPTIRAEIENLDIWLWGHGMIAPTPGFIWGEARASMQPNLGRVHFAHSDMSGISLFEEAYIRGQRAADNALNQST